MATGSVFQDNSDDVIPFDNVSVLHEHTDEVEGMYIVNTIIY